MMAAGTQIIENRAGSGRPSGSDQWAYLAGSVAVLIGAELVFFFPKHAQEAADARSLPGGGSHCRPRVEKLTPSGAGELQVRSARTGSRYIDCPLVSPTVLARESLENCRQRRAPACCRFSSSRILKNDPGRRAADIFFGGPVRGSDLQ